MKQKAYATLSSADEGDPNLDEDEFHETPAQIDEKVFVTRPFALALHKVSHVRWIRPPSLCSG